MQALPENERVTALILAPLVIFSIILPRIMAVEFCELWVWFPWSKPVRYTCGSARIILQETPFEDASGLSPADNLVATVGLVEVVGCFRASLAWRFMALLDAAPRLCKPLDAIAVAILSPTLQRAFGSVASGIGDVTCEGTEGVGLSDRVELAADDTVIEDVNGARTKSNARFALSLGNSLLKSFASEPYSLRGFGDAGSMNLKPTG